MRVDIDFDCYLYTYGNDEKVTLFQFFPGGDWDEDKSTLEEALKNILLHNSIGSRLKKINNISELNNEREQNEID